MEEVGLRGRQSGRQPSPTGTADEQQSLVDGRPEVNLAEVYKKKGAHKFRCPNCNFCIEKVTVEESENGSADTFTCTSCCSFLIPIGDCLKELWGREPADEDDSESRSDKKLEILKSIVYGGLTESITSLTIVTSAASADATTAHIVALALANLVGGFFIIGHNLRELKNEEPRGTSDQTDEQVDRYQEQLGQRQNFILHTTIALLSFLIFGLVPPLVYGFSFRKSDDKDYKIAAVAAASLLCIVILAICKAYVKKPPKNYIKTLMYYAVAGILASGVSYVAGDLMGKLIENLGWFKSEATVSIPLGEMSSWASY